MEPKKKTTKATEAAELLSRAHETRARILARLCTASHPRVVSDLADMYTHTVQIEDKLTGPRFGRLVLTISGSVLDEIERELGIETTAKPTVRVAPVLRIVPKSEVN